MTGLTRRTLLGTLGAAVVSACRCPSRTSRPDAAEAPPSGHATALLAAVDRAGGLDFVRPGDRVLLKVNANSQDHTRSRRARSSSRPSGACWSPAVHASWLAIARSGATPKRTRTSRPMASRPALAPLASSSRPLTHLPWVEIEPRLVPHWSPPFRVPRIAVEADHLINLACVKTHFITGVTLGLKNLLGLVRAEDRARPGNLRVHHDERIHHQIADVNRVLRPRLTIIDGFRALVSGGPTSHDGTPMIAEPGIMIADTDRIAAEVQAITLLQRYAPEAEAVHRTAPLDHPTLVAMRAGGLGSHAR